MKSVSKLIELFRSKGLRVTPQRRAIFEQLVKSNGHPTADDIIQNVNAIMPEVSQMTVYNTLHELVALGEINQVSALKDNKTRYDTNHTLHHHLYCTNCHTLIDIDIVSENLQISSNEAAGFKINRKQVTFYGICQKCQE